MWKRAMRAAVGLGLRQARVRALVESELKKNRAAAAAIGAPGPARFRTSSIDNIIAVVVRRPGAPDG